MRGVTLEKGVNKFMKNLLKTNENPEGKVFLYEFPKNTTNEEMWLLQYFIKEYVKTTSYKFKMGRVLGEEYKETGFEFYLTKSN